MRRYLEMALGYVIAGVFIVGSYAIAHYMIGIDDRAILVFVLAYWWSDMARFLNRPDNEPAK